MDDVYHHKEDDVEEDEGHEDVEKDEGHEDGVNLEAWVMEAVVQKVYRFDDVVVAAAGDECDAGYALVSV